MCTPEPILSEALCPLDFEFSFSNTSISIFGFPVLLEFSKIFNPLLDILLHAVFPCAKLILILYPYLFTHQNHDCSSKPFWIEFPYSSIHCQFRGHTSTIFSLTISLSLFTSLLLSRVITFSIENLLPYFLTVHSHIIRDVRLTPSTNFL